MALPHNTCKASFWRHRQPPQQDLHSTHQQRLVAPLLRLAAGPSDVAPLPPDLSVEDLVLLVVYAPLLKGVVCDLGQQSLLAGLGHLGLAASPLGGCLALAHAAAYVV